MEASTSTPTPVDPKAAAAAQGTGDDGLTDELRAAREGAILTPKEERSALDFLMGVQEPLQFDVDAQVDTPAGRKTVTFRITQMDPDKIEAIDHKCRNGETSIARLDGARFAAEMVGASTVMLRDPSGKEVGTRSPEWLASAPSKGEYSAPAAAMARSFQYQGGVLDQIVNRIQEVSGFDGTRVGEASRVLTEAGKG